MKCKFVWDRSTKGTERFKEVVPDGEQENIGTLYIKKRAVKRMAQTTPKVLEVEVTIVE